MADVIIPERDQKRIDDMVEAYRAQLENFYRMAYLQGDIDANAEAMTRFARATA